ncbi:NYN domain-containing protein [Corynebacterium comes]|uniref:NYN domain-containing protein n=1 Tax=Corynebacterium comes TaxID=2675218 RepID=A0A6B8WH83_9CORY|nr:NYN domain-containing protein [Corynebacterium comes]QGU05908.1 hypothetical protein CETAM_13415 [Corynebacterium comes]
MNSFTPTHSNRVIVTDIENVNDGSLRTPDDTRYCVALVSEILGITPLDQVIVATGKTSSPHLPGEVPDNWRVKVRSGLDGADMALDAILRDELPHRCFNEVVLVSGDHFFVEALDALAAAGMKVTVVSRPEALSKRLRFIADNVIYLPEATWPQRRAA